MILVTGATGLVGTHLVIKLLEEGVKLRALYRTEKKRQQAIEVIQHYLPADKKGNVNFIDWKVCDIVDIPKLTEVFEEVTHVYHCAANISFNPKDYKKLRKVNIEGTANIVNLCIEKNIEKLCYVSSIATLGEGVGLSIDEETEWNPETPNSVYAITKYGAEIEVWRGIQEGLNAIIVNPGIIIGSGYFEGGSGVLFRKIYKGLRYYTNGTSGYIAVKDVVSCMHLLMEGDYTNNRYILVAENLSFKDAFSMIAEALGVASPNKEVSPFLMKIAYYFQKVSNILFKVPQSIFKSSVRSAFLTKQYQNEKIKNTLHYNFIPISESIEETAVYFLEKYKR